MVSIDHSTESRSFHIFYHYRLGSGLIGQVPNKLHVDPCDLDVAGASRSRDINSARAAPAGGHRTLSRRGFRGA